MYTKKEFNENLKHILQNYPDFKEEYNKLSDEDKEILKKRHLEGNILHNIIMKHHTPHLMDDLSTKAHELLHDYLISKGFKKSRGRKAKIYAKGKAFIFKINKYLVAIKPNAYLKKEIDCSYIFFLEISTKRGKIYVDVRSGGGDHSVENDLEYSAYTAHFFDRYQERLGLVGDRESIIKKFMSTELKAVKKGSSLEFIKDKVIYNLSKGLALGISSGSGILLKTFISNNETNSFQERKKQELDEMMRINDLEYLKD